MSILEVNDLPYYDNSIESYEIHTYNPYNNNFSENDEIRIPVHQQDIYILPSASAVYIEGNVQLYDKDNKPLKKAVNFTNNPVLFLFQDIRYEINGIEIDRIKNAGITTCMKSYISMNEGESKVAAIWGWSLSGTSGSDFSAVVPLNKILGFAEDYKKIVMNCKHELILNRGQSVLNSVILSDDVAHIKINIQKVQWRVPHIKVSDYEKLSLLKLLEKDKPLQIAFRNWDLYEYPVLPRTTKHSWSVKTTSQIEKPRYVILGLQKNRKNSRALDCSLFDHCNVTNVTLFLNSQYFPYESMNLKFDENKYSILYDMYTRFRQSYYNIPPDPLLNLNNFKKNAPLFIIDCSRQNDNLKTGPVDVRIEIECSEYLPDNTTAYCLIINDRLIEYKPLSKIVRKLS